MIANSAARQDARTEPPLLREEVHVWTASLLHSAEQVSRYWRLLDEPERSRAERIRVDPARDQFITARAILRSILAQYVGMPPHELCLGTRHHGKPVLLTQPAGQTLTFNLSHSGNLALVAVSGQGEVGIDLEEIRRDLPYLELAEQFFSARESETLRRLPESQLPSAFFACWTRKEAIVKAIGQGLSLDLNSFHVSVLPGGVPRLLHAEWDREAQDRWLLYNIPCCDGYAAALAAEAPHRILRFRQWAAS